MVEWGMRDGEENGAKNTLSTDTEATTPGNVGTNIGEGTGNKIVERSSVMIMKGHHGPFRCPSGPSQQGAQRAAP